PELGADLPTRPPVPQRAILIHTLIHLYLQPADVWRLESQPWLARAGLHACAFERRQDARHFLWVRQPVEDRRGIANGDHVVFVEGVLNMVRLEVAVDAVIAAVGIIQPQRGTGESAQI